jgi:hypothetical protein
VWIDVDDRNTSHAFPDIPIVAPHQVLKMRREMRTDSGKEPGFSRRP